MRLKAKHKHKMNILMVCVCVCVCACFKARVERCWTFEINKMEKMKNLIQTKVIYRHFFSVFGITEDDGVRLNAIIHFIFWSSLFSSSVIELIKKRNNDTVHFHLFFFTENDAKKSVLKNSIVFVLLSLLLFQLSQKSDRTFCRIIHRFGSRKFHREKKLPNRKTNWIRTSIHLIVHSLAVERFWAYAEKVVASNNSKKKMGRQKVCEKNWYNIAKKRDEKEKWQTIHTYPTQQYNFFRYFFFSFHSLKIFFEILTWLNAGQTKSKKRKANQMQFYLWHSVFVAHMNAFNWYAKWNWEEKNENWRKVAAAGT